MGTLVINTTSQSISGRSPAYVGYANPFEGFQGSVTCAVTGSVLMPMRGSQVQEGSVAGVSTGDGILLLFLCCRLTAWERFVALLVRTLYVKQLWICRYVLLCIQCGVL